MSIVDCYFVVWFYRLNILGIIFYFLFIRIILILNRYIIRDFCIYCVNFFNFFFYRKLNKEKYNVVLLMDF